MMKLEEMTLDVDQRIEIQAAIGDVFRSVLYRFGEGFATPKGESLQMILEQWPGGRWFRDRGNGVGHLWGHVQVIKPPVLVELSGPMFMSYPAINHLEIKLEEIAGGTRVALRHRAIGFIEPAHREGVSTGWQHILNVIASDSTTKSAAQRT
ncbi:MAG TPA: SRPBCC domain-containing protein [Bryobacteraceae bacterium]|nr:SRPBCC domain-containing protein [Bryobacteraceae bacterium]